jgi:hypothetical protein
MLYRLKRHPFPVEAHFQHSLVLTYALRSDVLQAQLPPGLTVERFGKSGQLGFIAVAMVQTQALRPAALPKHVGRDFFLIGYRIFCRHRVGRHFRRGLRILRSDTDAPTMVCLGNLLTHYNYHWAKVQVAATEECLDLKVDTPRNEADLHVIASLRDRRATLPRGTCFKDVKAARRFAGPLPYTFDYEPETNSIIAIKATRANWDPTPVRVEVLRNTFLDQDPYSAGQPMLVSAFHISDIDYRWERGIRQTLPQLTRDRSNERTRL